MRARQASIQLQLDRSLRVRLSHARRAEDLACFLASCFPETEQALSGLAELLINAAELGNLSIGYDGKTNVIAKSLWQEKVERRLEMPEHRGMMVQVLLNQSDEQLVVTIRDEGNGFN